MKVKKNPKCIYKKIDNIGVILEPEHGKFIELNSTALHIWNSLDNYSEIDDLKAELSIHYNVDKDFNSDIDLFIENALNANILQKT